MRSAGLACLAANLVVAVGLTVQSMPASAAGAYPDKAVKLVVAWPPGGTADFFGREIASNLQQQLGQPFVVENVAGASGLIGATGVARSDPDGYTTLFGNAPEIAIAKNLLPTSGFDPQKDLAPVGLVFNVPLALVVPQNSAHNSVEDIIAAAKKNPGGVTYASAGTGTPGHLAAAAFGLQTGTDLLHVPYKGGGPALVDVMAGVVDFYLVGISAAAEHVKAGNLRILAVSSAKRSDMAPDVPTIAEVIGQDFNYTLWAGVLVPAGTDQAIVDKLNGALNAAVKSEAFGERLAKQGSEVRPTTPAEFNDFVQAEAAKYTEVINKLGLKVQ